MLLYELWLGLHSKVPTLDCWKTCPEHLPLFAASEAFAVRAQLISIGKWDLLVDHAV